MQTIHTVSQQTKFGYGFLVVGIGLAYLLDKAFGPLAAVIIASFCVVVGIGLLISGHRHQESRPRRGVMATIGYFTVIGTMIGEATGILSGIAWVLIQKRQKPVAWINARRQQPVTQPRTEESPKVSPQPPPSAPPQAKHTPSEALHRQSVLRGLVQEYLLSHDGLTPAEMAGTEITQREAEWINGRLKEKGETWKVSPTIKQSPPVQQPPVIIQTAPTFGNLKERARALSGEIMEDLLMQGWPRRPWGEQFPAYPVVHPMPTAPEQVREWTRQRSGYFRMRFFTEVLEMRNEFAQLHYRDERLDDFFKYQGMIEDANRQMAAINPQRKIDVPILPQEIEEVAERLRALADQIK